MRSLMAAACLLAAGSLNLSAAGDLSGRRAPGFSLPDVDFRYHDLADYRGKVVLLDIMKTSCPGCVTLTRTLERAKTKYGDKIAVLSVVNPPDTDGSIRQYILQHKVTTPILMDCGQVAMSYLKLGRGRMTVHQPHLFLIDKKGMIRNDFGHEETAVLKGEGLDEAIDRLLAE